MAMNISAQPLVSVITPAYNEQEHLAECIESILAQNYQNWDYTIVNNRSTDRTLEIAHQYASRDPRIRVHDNEQFLPMLANHNVAIRQISPASKYCKMVLADDYIFPQCLEKMVEVAEAHPSIGLVSAYEKCGEQIRMKGLPEDQVLVSGNEASRQFLMDKLLLFGSQNSVMYRADLVRKRNPFYVETEMYADFETCFWLLKSSDLGFVHGIMTFSRQRSGSVGAVSADLGAQHGSSLKMLLEYGRECLSPREFDQSLHRELNRYYDFLGRRAIVERDDAFWDYHKRTLANLEIDFSRWRLTKAAALQLLGSLFNPKSTMESIRRLFSLRRIRNAQTRRVVSSFETKSVDTHDRPIARS
jgi:glycosyltransferase involved in cell wall biosynthesis